MVSPPDTETQVCVHLPQQWEGTGGAVFADTALKRHDWGCFLCAQPSEGALTQEVLRPKEVAPLLVCTATGSFRQHANSIRLRCLMSGVTALSPRTKLEGICQPVSICCRGNRPRSANRIQSLIRCLEFRCVWVIRVHLVAFG